MVQYVSSKFNFKVNSNEQSFAVLCLLFFQSKASAVKMLGDNLKIFVHGLPLDCEEHSLKDFLEGKVYANE